jgi:hypothetical protein
MPEPEGLALVYVISRGDEAGCDPCARQLQNWGYDTVWLCSLRPGTLVPNALSSPTEQFGNDLWLNKEGLCGLEVSTIYTLIG